MANEYLKRTLTSSGNSRRWTISFWMKNNDPTQGYTAIIGAGKLSPSNVYNEIFYNSSQIGINLDNASASDNYNITANPLLRDPSSWMHVIVSFTDQGDNANTRLKFYINGGFVDHNTGTGLDVSETSFFNNVNYIQYIGSRAQQSAGTTTFDGQYFDVFLVDGQTLTPDVFGFYKDGDGYMSSGTVNSTDFKPGQWSPHSPSKIKKDINRRGGFGVNGYYLPMNDSSNPGADFHCDPNSIIKLKGEDLPQPRNGAPTTSDAYVSQLRTDPFAANLVLAVPGASTATGANLVTNGTFDTNTTGWVSEASATLSVDNGRLKVFTTNTSYGSANQTVTGLTVGQRYTFQVDMFYGNASLVTVISGATPSINSGWQSADYVWRASFTATTTSLVIDFQMASQANKYGFWDNAILKQEDAPRDYSADIRGSGSNKTLTATGGAGVGYEIPSYYGSAMTFDGTGDYFTIPANTSDLIMGSNDFTIEAWVNKNDTISGDIFGLYNNGTNRRSYLLYSDGSGDLSAIVSTDGTSATNTQLGTSAATNLGTNQWHHCALEREGSYLRLYLNGVVAGIATNLSGSLYENTTDRPAIGAWFNSGVATGDINGYVQDLRVYKGVAKYKGGFDVPKPYTPVGIEAFRTTDDTCKNNFATWNPLTGAGNAANDSAAALKDGNLYYDNANQSQVTSTIGMSSGKWYTEYHLIGSSVSGYLGVTGDERAPKNNQGTYTNVGQSLIRPGAAVDNSFTKNWTATSLTTMNPALGYSSGDVFGFALDLDSSPKTLKFYRNNTLIHTDSTIGDSGHYYFVAFRTNDGSNGANWADVIANFGQNPSFSGTITAGTNADTSGKGLFKYAPPSGFLALCEDNLPTPAIADPGKHFKSVLYTGSGSARNVTGVGFKPDLVWIKDRDTANYHNIHDSVRPANLRLSTNVPDAENNGSAGGAVPQLGSFDNDGFSLPTGNVNTNASGDKYVAWCWKAGGAAVSNTDGTITSQVSANQDAGFSIVSYTGNNTNGASIGHGLGKKPSFMIVKERTGASGWFVYHKDLGATKFLSLHDVTPAGTETGSGSCWFATEPTSSVFTVGANGATNENNRPIISYCWTEIEGYSKFGSYVGNGVVDGPFVYCGFKPAFVLIKLSSNTNGHWVLWDSSRTPTNLAATALSPNNSWTDTINFDIDLLSNGFKQRDTETSLNTSGETYIFAAFAESPFQTANAK